jgi:hypothetical protein
MSAVEESTDNQDEVSVSILENLGCCFAQVDGRSEGGGMWRLVVRKAGKERVLTCPREGAEPVESLVTSRILPDGKVFYLLAGTAAEPVARIKEMFTFEGAGFEAMEEAATTGKRRRSSDSGESCDDTCVDRDGVLISGVAVDKAAEKVRCVQHLIRMMEPETFSALLPGCVLTMAHYWRLMDTARMAGACGGVVAPELGMLRMTGAIMDSPVMSSSAQLGVFLKGAWDLFDMSGMSLFFFAPNHVGYIFGRLPTPAGRAVIRTMLEEFFVACSATINSSFGGRAGALTVSLRDLDHPSWAQGDEYLFLKLHTAIGVFFQALMYGDPPPGQSWRGEGAVDLLVEHLWAVLVAERHQDTYPHSLFFDGGRRSHPEGWAADVWV